MQRTTVTRRSAGALSPSSVSPPWRRGGETERPVEASATGVGATDRQQLALRGAAAAALLGGPAVELPGPAAHAGLREDQLDAGRGVVVAGDRGDDAPGLLEPGQRE